MCNFNCENAILCKLMNNISQETWERIGFARTHKGLKIYETTITQNLIYLFRRYANNSSIWVYEADDEKTNGNDLEILVKRGGEFYYFPVQAKIIYKQGRYDRIKHQDQISSLINYARTKSGFPLYILYYNA